MKLRKPPPHGIFKINMDVATFANIGATRIGVVIRDWRGRVVLAVAMRIQESMEVHHAEARAVMEGLHKAWEMGLWSIILEGDAKNVFEAFEKSEVDLSYTWSILSNAFILAQNFHYFKAQYVPRGCNTIPDKLVEIARNRYSQVWTNEAPMCARDVLSFDASAWINSYFKFKKKKKNWFVLPGSSTQNHMSLFGLHVFEKKKKNVFN